MFVRNYTRGEDTKLSGCATDLTHTCFLEKHIFSQKLDKERELDNSRRGTGINSEMLIPKLFLLFALLLFSTTFSIYNRGEKHTVFTVHMISRYIYIYSMIFFTVLLVQIFFLRHVLVVYDPRNFRELIFLLIRRFFPQATEQHSSMCAPKLHY